MKTTRHDPSGHPSVSLATRLAVTIIFLLGAAFSTPARSSDNSFDDGWRFKCCDTSQVQAIGFDDSAWETVSLPHTAHVEALVTGGKNLQWQGICWYRKAFYLPTTASGKTITLRFDGAMNIAEIWVNGKSVGKFMGGYLPYVADISALVQPGTTNLVAVRLDNQDNPLTGPKPLADLDFNLYGGLYRHAHLIIQDTLHITDPILADKTASGGVFITYPSVSSTRAIVRAQTHVQNSSSTIRHFVVRTTLLSLKGKKIASTESPAQELPAAGEQEITQEIEVHNPKLWSPATPDLYLVRSEILEDGRLIDTAETRVGIRRIEITKESFRINGEPMFLRGANRHQEYPYIGNALSDAAQYRDALKIKEAGFDYVRCSHYPPSPAFLDACDELGIVVMDSLMGWQYFNHDPAFTDLKLRECHEMIRRDRNHPSIILWEVSLNETAMPATFVRQASAIAHQEYPGDQCFTAGWQKGYDVFIQARQHGGCVGITNQPCIISEYGDWEYYAQNAGFEQDKWKDLKPADRSSRQLRDDGDARLLQQAMNFQEAHNDNLKTPAFGDSIWVMFDYNRGYADDLESSGVMDIFRLPKFGYWFFRSQRDPEEKIAYKPIGPVLFIANYWTADSPLDVRVYSNCEEVELYLNGKLIERRRPDTDRTTTKLKHPPFTFKLSRFEPGELKAISFIHGRKVASCETWTPQDVSQLTLQLDHPDKQFDHADHDAVFCHATLTDHTGETVPTAKTPVFFGATGQVRFTGNNPATAEAGIATILAENNPADRSGAIFALSETAQSDHLGIICSCLPAQGIKSPKYEVRYTTDGSKPTIKSSIYSGLIPEVAQINATVFVNDEPVITASFPSHH